MKANGLNTVQQRPGFYPAHHTIHAIHVPYAIPAFSE